jgi:hypothetical protein
MQTNLIFAYLVDVVLSHSGKWSDGSAGDSFLPADDWDEGDFRVALEDFESAWLSWPTLAPA